MADKGADGGGETSDASGVTPPPRRSGYRTLIGYTTKVWAENHGEVELILGPRHLNTIGLVHGGVYATLLDAAMGHAVSFCAVPGNARYSSTLSLNTIFLKSARAGVLTAIGRVHAIEGRVATCVGEVRDETGILLATAQGSFMYFPGSEHSQGVPRRNPID